MYVEGGPEWALEGADASLSPRKVKEIVEHLRQHAREELFSPIVIRER
jgi:hypothetical protein